MRDISVIQNFVVVHVRLNGNGIMTLNILLAKK